MRYASDLFSRLAIIFVYVPRFPDEIGATWAYATMLLSWSASGGFRNFMRAWRESHLIGGWQSTSLALYITFTALRFATHPHLKSDKAEDRAVLYYFLFPVGVVCECWILMRIIPIGSPVGSIITATTLFIRILGISLPFHLLRSANLESLRVW